MYQGLGGGLEKIFVFPPSDCKANEILSSPFLCLECGSVKTRCLVLWQPLCDQEAQGFKIIGRQVTGEVAKLPPNLTELPGEKLEA